MMIIGIIGYIIDSLKFKRSIQILYLKAGAPRKRLYLPAKSNGNPAQMTLGVNDSVTIQMRNLFVFIRPSDPQIIS